MKKQDNISRSRRKKVHALAKAGRFDKAISLCEKLCSRDGRDFESWSLLARLYKQVGRKDDMIRCFKHVADSNPGSVDALSTLASEYIRQNNAKMAEKYFHQAVLLQPDDPKIYTNYGYVLANMQRHSEAEPHFRKALQLDETLSLVYSSLAGSLRSQGKIEQAIDCYEKGLSVADDDSVMHSNYLLSLHYLAEQRPQNVYEAHKQWVKRHVKQEGDFAYEDIKNADPEKILRIGYVSTDFRTHSVAYFLAPLFSNHDKANFKIYCYSNVPNPDQTTNTLRKYVDHWRDTANLSDKELERSIRADDIDILIDLSGHTAGNRLTVFARKPAPIEVTWLGYPDTTGLDAIDYRITDSLADPVEFDEQYSEKLYRVEGCFLCYQQLFDTPDVAPSPFNSNGYITFGSFNNLSKVNDKVLQTWANILEQVPESRLQIKNPSLTDGAVREHFLSVFTDCGIAQERIILKGLSPTTMEHLTEYNNIDIALDTFPYNGTTTTCEALWMGVPVLTVTGGTHANCVGKSLLTAAGLSMWVTETIDEFVKTAISHAKTPELLNQQRMNIRPNMLNSALCDGRSFAKKIEKAYRYMWHEICEKSHNK